MCIFGNYEEGERTICINCIQNTDKLNIFHLLNCINILAETKVMNEDIKGIKDRYFELKKKKLNVGEIYNIIIEEFKNRL